MIDDGYENLLMFKNVGKSEADAMRVQSYSNNVASHTLENNSQKLQIPRVQLTTDVIDLGQHVSNHSPLPSESRARIMVRELKSYANHVAFTHLRKKI